MTLGDTKSAHYLQPVGHPVDCQNISGTQNKMSSDAGKILALCFKDRFTSRLHPGTIRRSHPSRKILNQFHALASAFLIGKRLFSYQCNGRRVKSTLAVARSSMLFFWAAFCLRCAMANFSAETVSRLTDVLVCDKMLERLLVDHQSGCPWFHDVRHTQGISMTGSLES